MSFSCENRHHFDITAIYIVSRNLFPCLVISAQITYNSFLKIANLNKLRASTKTETRFEGDIRIQIAVKSFTVAVNRKYFSK